VYDVNKAVVDVYAAICTYAQQPEMYKTFRNCAAVGADGRTSGLEQLFTAQVVWNISGTLTCQVHATLFSFLFLKFYFNFVKYKNYLF
jgi:hypothetical protein